jgi:Protein of unknown function (DUF3574)
MPINLSKDFVKPTLISLFLMGAIAPTVYAHPKPELLTQPIAAKPSQPTLRCKTLGPGELFARTELYFGLSKADGSIISDADFGKFIDQEVTPRFPDGLTLISGLGQFKNAAGVIIREPSRLLILFYPLGDRENNKKLEAIRSAYKSTFQQESVLRTDAQTCVAF